MEQNSRCYDGQIWWTLYSKSKFVMTGFTSIKEAFICESWKSCCGGKNNLKESTRPAGERMTSPAQTLGLLASALLFIILPKGESNFSLNLIYVNVIHTCFIIVKLYSSVSFIPERLMRRLHNWILVIKLRIQFLTNLKKYSDLLIKIVNSRSYRLDLDCLQKQLVLAKSIFFT